MALRNNGVRVKPGLPLVLTDVCAGLCPTPRDVERFPRRRSQGDISISLINRTARLIDVRMASSNISNLPTRYRLVEKVGRFVPPPSRSPSPESRRGSSRRGQSGLCDAKSHDGRGNRAGCRVRLDEASIRPFRKGTYWQCDFSKRLSREPLCGLLFREFSTAWAQGGGQQQ